MIILKLLVSILQSNFSLSSRHVCMCIRNLIHGYIQCVCVYSLVYDYIYTVCMCVQFSI